MKASTPLRKGRKAGSPKGGSFMGRYGKWIALLAALAITGFLIYRLLRNMDYRFSDVWDSQWWKDGRTHAEIGKQSVIPEEFWGKELIVMNSPTLIKAGDKVTVTFDNDRDTIANGVAEVLYVYKMKALVLNRGVKSVTNPPSGTVKLDNQ